MDYVVAVDPGDKHVGVATWVSGELAPVCVEIPAGNAANEIAAMLRHAITTGHKVHLVIEAFQLYADKAEAQIGSSMQTSQLIGALKYIAGQMEIPVTEQGALILTATKAQLKARGIKLSGSIHAREAGCHACHFILFHELGLR